MPPRRSGIAVGLLGVCFLAFYLVVRLLFMQRLDAAIAEANVHGVGDLLENLSGPVVVWLVWGYSFRVGMLLAILGGALHAGMGRRWILAIAAGGGAYLATCYLPFVDYSPRYYGVLGTAILALFLFLVRDWMRRRPALSGDARIAGDLRMIAHYLLVTGTWSLCGIFGIVTYALQPEVMLARGLRPAAAMLTSHVMAELTLGWFLLVLASRREPLPAAALPGAPRGAAARAAA